MLGTGCLQTQATGGCNVKRYGDNRVKWNVEGSGEDKKNPGLGGPNPGRGRRYPLALWLRELLGPGCPRPKLRGGAMSILRWNC
jgi:hypothetical protein